MGFGILFIGCFFLLNKTYFFYTDIICALIISMALNKLSFVNSKFKAALYPSLLFAVLGAAELILKIYSLFSYGFDDTAITPYTSFARSILILLTLTFILLGIEDVAKEVGLSSLAKKAKLIIPFMLTAYTLNAVFELPFIGNFATTKQLAIFSFAFLCITFIIEIFILIQIYSAYMRICMPGENQKTSDSSKFEFVNKFRRHEDEKRQQYIDYKLSKLKNKSERKNEERKKK